MLLLVNKAETPRKGDKLNLVTSSRTTLIMAQYRQRRISMQRCFPQFRLLNIKFCTLSIQKLNRIRTSRARSNFSLLPINASIFCYHRLLLKILRSHLAKVE